MISLAVISLRDIIKLLKKNDQITDYKVLEGLMAECNPYEKVNVKLYRSGRYYTTTITVASNNAIG